MNSPHHPRSVPSNLMIQTVGEETLLYDEQRHQAFCLNRVSAAIWRLCQGKRSLSDIAAAATVELGAPVSEELVLHALNDLQGQHLIPAEPVFLPAPVLSRRAMMGRLGATAAVLLPVVTMIAAPRAAQAYSGNFSSATPATPSEGSGSSQPASAPATSEPAAKSSDWSWKP